MQIKTRQLHLHQCVAIFQIVIFADICIRNGLCTWLIVNTLCLDASYLLMQIWRWLFSFPMCTTTYKNAYDFFFYIYDKFDCFFRKKSSFLLMLGELILNIVLLPSNKTLSSFVYFSFLSFFLSLQAPIEYGFLFKSIFLLKENMRKRKRDFKCFCI